MTEKINVMIPEEEVAQRIEEIGKKISEDYAGKQVHMICVLKGGVFFMCELAKRISVPVSMDFMSVSSYGDGTSSSGVVKIAKDLDESLEGKDVLVVEDIIRIMIMFFFPVKGDVISNFGFITHFDFQFHESNQMFSIYVHIHNKYLQKFYDVYIILR